MRKIIEFCVSKYKLILILVALVSLLMLVSLIFLEIDPSVDNIIPIGEEFKDFAKRNSLSEQDKYYIVGIEKTENGFTLEQMQAFYKSIEEIKKIKEIKSTISPFDSSDFTSDKNRLVIKPLLNSKMPENQEELDILLSGLLDNPMYKGQVVNDDNSIIMVIFTADVENKYSQKFVKSIDEALKPVRELSKTYMMGEDIIVARVNHYLIRDTIKVLILAAIVISLSFYFGFGFKVKGMVIIPLSVVFIGVIWTLGVISLLNWPLTIISICIPVLVLSIGSSYTVHFLSQYFKDYKVAKDENLSKAGWILRSSEKINKTIFLAGLTTIVGFICLLATSVDKIREFGIATSIGIFICMILSLTYIPALLMAMKAPEVPEEKKSKKKGITLSDISAFVGKISVKGRWYLVAAFFLSLILYFSFQSLIASQTDYLSYFPKKDPYVKNMGEFIAKTGGYQMLNVTFTSDEKKFFLKSDTLENLSELEEKVLTNNNITNIASFTSYMKGVHKRAFNTDMDFSQRGEVLLLYRLLSAMQKQDTAASSIKNFIDNDASRVTLAIKMYNSKIDRSITEIELQKIYKYLEDNFSSFAKANNLKFNIWGSDLRFINTTNTLNRDQMISSALAIFILFIIMAIAFKSIIKAIIALIPLLSCIFMNYIAMVIFRIPQDITTALVGSIAMGVAVDNAIHYILNYNINIEKLDSKMAIIETHRYTGRPIIHTSVSVILGLAFLGISSYKAIAFFGVLICLTLLFAMVSTLTVMPSFLSFIKKRK